MAQAMIILLRQLDYSEATLKEHLNRIELCLANDLQGLSPAKISLLVDRQCQIEEALQQINVCKKQLTSPAHHV